MPEKDRKDLAAFSKQMSNLSNQNNDKLSLKKKMIKVSESQRSSGLSNIKISASKQ
jgi:hypothetical protein